MPLTYLENNFFNSAYGIRHITIWEQVLKDKASTTVLRFVDSDPKFIVMADIPPSGHADDATIFYSLRVNDIKIENLMRENENALLDLINSYPKENHLIINVKDMKRIFWSDFKFLSPQNGLNSYFIFSDQKEEEGLYYSIFAPTASYDEQETLNILISYLYSSTLCLHPIDKPTLFSKRFLQALCPLAFYKGDMQKIKLSRSPVLSSTPIGHLNGYVNLKNPGKGNRFKELVSASKEEYKKNKEKLERREKHNSLIDFSRRIH